MLLAVLLLSGLVLILGYAFYARRLANEATRPERRRPTPARRRMDGKEFMPAPAGVLFGFQFRAIGLDPLLGAVVAVQFGWLPALLWLILGALLAGWVQDFLAAMISAREGGANLGALAGAWISPAARRLLLILVCGYLLVILAAFTVTVPLLLARESVAVGVAWLVPAGWLAGRMVYRWKVGTWAAALAAVPLALAGAYAGTLPWAQGLVRWINGLAGEGQGGLWLRGLWGYGDVTWVGFVWGILLLAFAWLGAALPAWKFIQPIHFTASGVVLVGVAAALAGLARATFSDASALAFEIPAVTRLHQPHLGPLWPALFALASGGAVSGWGALVATFSTSRSLERETHALPVTAGAAFAQAFLAVLAVIFAAALGVSAGRYDPGQAYRLVAGPASVFVAGMGRFLGLLGLPIALAETFGVFLLAAFGVTTTPLVLRYLGQSGAELLGGALPGFRKAAFGTLVAALLALFLAFSGLWQWLWVAFGGASSLLAGAVLLLGAAWLGRQGKRNGWAFWPGLFLLVTGLAALLYVALFTALYRGILLNGFQDVAAALGNGVSALYGLFLVVCGAALGVEALRALRRKG